MLLPSHQLKERERDERTSHSSNIKSPELVCSQDVDISS